MKKLIGMLLVMTLMLSIIPVVGCADDSSEVSCYCGDNLECVFKNDTLTIYGKGEMKRRVVFLDDGNYAVKTVIIKSGVTGICEGAFQNYDDLEKVQLPSSLKTIGESAFQGCDSLKECNIPDSVTSIGLGAFAGCEKLEAINIPNSLKNIDNAVFDNCKSLKKINVPEGITEIGGGAFSGCNMLETVTLPSSLEKVGNYAFSNCSSLTSISIPDGVTSICSSAFEKCVSLQTVDFGKVKSIGASAFSDCSSIKKLSLPETLETIDRAAFSRTSIETISLPSKVSNIGPWAFYECESLKTVSLNNGLKTIGNCAFGKCIKLEKIEIPASVVEFSEPEFKDIRHGQFIYDENLSVIVFRGNIPTMPEEAFNTIIATAYYPDNNNTYNSTTMKDYGGKITWEKLTNETDATESTKPSETVKPSESTNPSETVKPSESPKPSETVTPTESPKPSEAVIPSKTSDKIIAYSDVPNTGKWYSDAVYYAAEKGYMAGIGKNRFNPTGTVTRGTIAQILYAAEGKPAVSGTSKFTDVKAGKWYTNAVSWAADNGLVSGYGNGKFGPENDVTREQMVAIMYKYSEMKGYDLTASADLSKFADQKDISKWAIKSMKWGVGHKVISGTKNGIEPKGSATRAQIAVILQAYDNNVRK